MNASDGAHGGLNAAVAATLNGERTAAGMTQDDLAERSGVKKRTLMRLLNAQRDIDVNVMAKLGAVFNLTPAEVLTRAEDWQRRNPEGSPMASETTEAALKIVEEARRRVRAEGDGEDVVGDDSSRKIRSAKRHQG